MLFSKTFPRKRYICTKIKKEYQITMSKVRGAVIIDKEKCKGCGVCIVDCPTDTLAFNKSVNSKGYHYAYMIAPELCIGCSNCAISCPDTVVQVYRVRPQKRRK